MIKPRIIFMWLVVLFGWTAISPDIRVHGQWDKKPYQQWTVDEVNKLLTDSPWAQTKDKGFADVLDSPVLSGGNVLSAGTVTIRLRSALPVREALARLRQLKSKYDKLSDGEKVKVDEKNKPLLECPACDDNYVVALGPEPGSQRGVPSILQTMSFGEAKQNVQISNERGEKRELVHFTQPRFQGDEAVFFFSRLNEKGQPLLTTTSQKLIVSLGPKILGSGPTPIASFTFDVSKMIVNGQVAF